MSDNVIDRTAILADLRTATLPRTVRCHPLVGSTMDVARQLLASLAEEELPLLVQTDEQTSGRGRLGRAWVAPPGSALLLSLAMRPTWLAASRATALVWMAGVALCDAVSEQTGLAAALKWPNDLLVPAPGGGSLDWAIIGVGVNVGDSPPPGATRYPSTSLRASAGRPIDRLALLRALLRHLDAWHGRLMAGDEPALFEAWRQRLHTLGQVVTVQLPQGAVTGMAEAVGRDGALMLRDEAGDLQIITTGDVGL